jgi:ketosteroid isomerase-like protein
MKTLTLLFILLTAAVTVAAQSDGEKAKIAAAIRSVMTEQSAAWNRGDIDGFMEGYWRSDDLVFVSSRVTRGWQATLDNYKRSYPTKERMGTLSFSDLEITVLSKDSALVLGSWALKRANDAPGGKFTLIFRKFKDGWRVIHDHTS